MWKLCAQLRNKWNKEKQTILLTIKEDLVYLIIIKEWTHLKMIGGKMGISQSPTSGKSQTD